MGKRYTAIVKWLGHDVVGFDQGDPWKNAIDQKPDRTIIASPTIKHYDHCMSCISADIPFLCEKPISKDIDEVVAIRDRCIETGVDGRMVCNWAFLSKVPLQPGTCNISYSHYNTGNDGLFWDMIQPIYLARFKDGKYQISISTESPTFNCHIFNSQFSIISQNPNSIEFHATLDMFAKSYECMIDSWLSDPTSLWDLDSAVDATQKVLEYKAQILEHYKWLCMQ